MASRRRGAAEKKKTDASPTHPGWMNEEGAIMRQWHGGADTDKPIRAWRLQEKPRTSVLQKFETLHLTKHNIACKCNIWGSPAFRQKPEQCMSEEHQYAAN
mmetsp:Transcript_19837/g.43068  ORF Transcript_19837/g.43068 Transcript_19837/m.43068 type:complete len:101 (+) Transcript_19837:29-331(+)